LARGSRVSLFSATLSLSRFSSLSISRISLSLDLSSQSHSLPLAVSVFGQEEQRREMMKEEERRKKKKIIKRREVYPVILERRDIIFL